MKTKEFIKEHRKEIIIGAACTVAGALIFYAGFKIGQNTFNISIKNMMAKQAEKSSSVMMVHKKKRYFMFPTLLPEGKKVEIWHYDIDEGGRRLGEVFKEDVISELGNDLTADSRIDTVEFTKLFDK